MIQTVLIIVIIAISKTYDIIKVKEESSEIFVLEG